MSRSRACSCLASQVVRSVLSWAELCPEIVILGDLCSVELIEDVGDCVDGAVPVVLQGVGGSSLELGTAVVVYHIIYSCLCLLELISIFIPDGLLDIEVAKGIDNGVERSSEVGFVYDLSLSR